MSTCPTPEKRSYDSAEAAIAATADHPMRQQPYPCICGRVHTRTLSKVRKKNATSNEAGIKANATANAEPWPSEAVADLIAGVGRRTVARRYGRTFLAVENKVNLLRRQGRM